MKLTPRKPADILLGLFISTDMLLIIAHILFLTTATVYDDNYSILMGRGFGETFQYFKAYWVALMFGWLVLVTREASYLAWAAVFTYFGLDDLLELHEEVGLDLAIRYDFPAILGQRSDDLGEWTVFAVAGAVLLTVLAFAYYRGSTSFRERSWSMLRFSALLAFFGIVVDAIHILFLETVADDPLGIIEDGGEMIVLSVVCWYVFRLLVAESQTDLRVEEHGVSATARRR